ncbi:unnamed protein product [Chrysoparadoxa australica]
MTRYGNGKALNIGIPDATRTMSPMDDDRPGSPMKKLKMVGTDRDGASHAIAVDAGALPGFSTQAPNNASLVHLAPKPQTVSAPKPHALAAAAAARRAATGGRGVGAEAEAQAQVGSFAWEFT